MRAQERFAQPFDSDFLAAIPAPNNVEPASELVVHVHEIGANAIECGVNARRQRELPELAEPVGPVDRVHSEGPSDSHVPADAGALLVAPDAGRIGDIRPKAPVLGIAYELQSELVFAGVRGEWPEDQVLGSAGVGARPKQESHDEQDEESNREWNRE